VKYFTENKENLDPISLAYLIDKCNNIRDDIFSNINKYNLKENDIFSLNENKNYIFFRELVNRNIIQKIQNKKQKYIVDTMRVIESILQKIKENEIQFNILYPYFKDGGQSEEMLKNKILIIFFNDEEASFKYFGILKTKVLTTIKIKEQFTYVCRYFMNFYPNAHKDDINNITTIIFNLESNSLNYFELNCKKEYEKYKEYLDKAEKSSDKKNSALYNQIYNDSKKNHKDDYIKCIEETETKFNKLQKLFEKEGIDQIDEEILDICTKLFIEDKKEISLELKQLMKIFKISKNNNEIEDIKNGILLILKEKNILKAISSINFFIDQIEAQKGNYSKAIKNPIISLKVRGKISSLKEKLEFLNNIDINPLNGENNYIKNKEEQQKVKPIKLKDKKEEIEIKKIKLLFNMIFQECSYLKKIASENDNSLLSANELLDMEKCNELTKVLGNLDGLKLKENISKSEFENILIQFNKFIINYGHIKALKSSLVESFIKKTKEFIENGFSILLQNINIEKCNEEKDNNNKVNNFINNVNEIISFDKNGPFSKLFFEEEEELFNKMNNIFQKINNNLKNNEAILKKKNEELNEIIHRLKFDLKKEKEVNNNLSLNIKKLEKEINEEKKQKNDLNKKENNNHNISQSNGALELLIKKLEEKEDEIKELKTILPFEYSKGENILTVTFLSANENIHYSMICKNTDDFHRLQNKFYEKYPEYQKYKNIFLIKGKKIKKSKNLKDNNIKDNDIIVVKQEIKDNKI